MLTTRFLISTAGALHMEREKERMRGATSMLQKDFKKIVAGTLM